MADHIPSTLAGLFTVPSSDINYGYEQTIFGSYTAEKAREFAQKIKKEKLLEDYMPNTEEFMGVKNSYEHWKWRFGKVMEKINDKELVVVFLTLISFLTATCAILVEIIVYYLLAGREYLLSYISNFWSGYAIYVTHTITLTALSLYFTHKIAPNAAGSGLPEMKCILSGLTLSTFLSTKTLIAKFLGLTTAVAAGLPVGRQGPFVHIASCLVQMISSLRCFRNFQINQSLRLQLLAAACAVGLSVTYGAPIGGVLYSIEVTSTYYPIRYYWAAFIASIVSGFLYRAFVNLFNNHTYLLPLIPTNFSLGKLYMTWYEWAVLIILAVLGSLLGVVYVNLNNHIVEFRRRYAGRFPILGPFAFTLMVALVTGFIFYPKLFGSYMDLPALVSMADLLADRPLVHYGDLKGDWTPYSIFLSLFLFFFFRFFLGLCASSTAVPVGLFAPTMALGACLGRFFGEIVALLWPQKSISPAVYSIIGCCSFAGSITQAISTAVIILEITGDLNFLCPALVSSVIAVGISRKITFNIYDSVLIIRRLPYLPDLPDLKHRTHNLNAKDFMKIGVSVLTLRTSLKELEILLEISTLEDQNLKNIAIPIVEDKKRYLFIGNTDFETLYSFYRQLNRELKKQEVQLKSLVTEGKGLIEDLSNIKFDLRPRLKQILCSNPIQCTPETPIATVHIMFATLYLMNIFVVKNGKLIGIITRSVLKEALMA